MASDYGCTMDELVQLMEFRGSDGVEKIVSDYGDVFELCGRLKTSAQGLTDQRDIIKRRDVFGANVIAPTKTVLQVVVQSLRGFALPLLLSVVVSSGVSFFSLILGAAIFSGVVSVALIKAINVYWKETKLRAGQAKIEAGRKCTVIRNGEQAALAASELVVGDICLVKEGDELPADGVVIQSEDLKIDEFAFTGENDHVEKGVHIDPVLLSGTRVAQGSGLLVVAVVGVKTQAGIIMELLGAAQAATEEKTE